MLERALYDRFRVAPLDPARLRVTHVESILQRLSEASAGRLRVEKFAESVQCRPIYLATIGSGARTALLWTQMHGDEPTHTAVVLDLLNYLLQEPAPPQAAEILAGCTLHIIPMLNPDGAEAVSRFNAQGIDVNRDAARLATPEGRALRRAVETLRPQFGFNLHNQNARTSVGNPPRPAAVSVLAPPPDARRTETPAMRQAKQMCACFVEAVRPHAARMISRYDDTYEPRAFGDTIQSLGTATMLVEVGGWPETDSEPLTRLHFHGLLATLHAIATDGLPNANTDTYELLPRSNSRQFHDRLISGGHLLDAAAAAPFRADVALDHSHGSRVAVAPRGDGKLVDIGDLSTMAGKLSIDASNMLVLPGRVAVLKDWQPPASPSAGQLEELLARGATSVLAMIELADREALEALGDAAELPLNWGFVGRLTGPLSLGRRELLERVALAAFHGALAVVVEAADESLWQSVQRLRLPLLQPEQLPSLADPSGSYAELAQRSAAACKLLGLHAQRGRLGRGCYGDLQLFAWGGQRDASQPVDWRRLQRVMVAGETVWQDGKRTSAKAGVQLRRTAAEPLAS